MRNRCTDIRREKTISLFRCDVCEAGYNSSNCFHDEFFERECLCCGSDDHSFLDIRYEEEGKDMVSLICSCPLASHSAVKERKLSVNNRKHWLDPKRVAKESGYQEKEVDYVMERIQIRGCGRRMCPDDVSRIQEAAHHSCEMERSMCHFTRDVAYLPVSDLDEQGSEEDMMSICSSTTGGL